MSIIIQMCLGPQVIPPTQKARNYKKTLKILMFIQVAIVLLNFIAGSVFLQQGVFGLFFIFLFYIIQHQCSFNAIMIFIFVGLFFAVSFMVFFLTPLQNQVSPNSYRSFDQYVYADSIISFVYYVAAMIFCFYPYREFKAIAFNQNPALRQYFEQEQQGYVSNNQRENPDERRIQYEPEYGNINYDQNRRNNDHGTYEVFRGQGVIVG